MKDFKKVYQVVQQDGTVLSTFNNYTDALLFAKGTAYEIIEQLELF